MQNYVLDSSAIIAFFRAEIGAEKVKNILSEAANSQCVIFTHHATVAECYYRFLYTFQTDEVDRIIRRLKSHPINFVEIISDDLIKWIGYFKTRYKISFADTFVLSTAKLNNAKVVSSDHHEFDAVEQSGDVLFEWIR